ncbi:hypothetical protein AB1Y20_005747 [Prymnesium parvum]|uniref:CRAL-TRIO domain-containing protein n=1 Tax=Prymnesium parvum TaxID=97485 RepID=A0AB34J091_PRYPA
MAVVSAATAAWVVARAERRAQAQLSAAESDALEQFYALLAPRRVDKVTAVWFLRSHSNARLAAASCVRMCEWREQKQRADDLAGRPLDIPASVKSALDAAFSPVALDGVDALGRPIMYTPCGNVNLPALAKEGVTLELLVRRYVVAAEKVRWALLKSDDPLQGHLQILDLYGIDVAAFLGSMPFYSAIISVGERYFPSLLGCMCVVRCPEAAEWLVATIRKLMDEKAASSIQLVKGDPQLGLRELVPNELLPANLRVPVPSRTRSPQLDFSMLSCCKPCHAPDPVPCEVALEEDMKPLQRVGLETRMLAEKLIKAGQRSMSKTGDALSSVGISMFGADHKSAKESSNVGSSASKSILHHTIRST